MLFPLSKAPAFPLDGAWGQHSPSPYLFPPPVHAALQGKLLLQTVGIPWGWGSSFPGCLRYFLVPEECFLHTKGPDDQPQRAHPSPRAPHGEEEGGRCGPRHLRGRWNSHAKYGMQGLSGLINTLPSRCTGPDLQTFCLLCGSPARQPSASALRRSPTELPSSVSDALLSSSAKRFAVWKIICCQDRLGKDGEQFCVSAHTGGCFMTCKNNPCNNNARSGRAE